MVLRRLLINHTGYLRGKVSVLKSESLSSYHLRVYLRRQCGKNCRRGNIFLNYVLVDFPPLCVSKCHLSWIVSRYCLITLLEWIWDVSLGRTVGVETPNKVSESLTCYRQSDHDCHGENVIQTLDVPWWLWLTYDYLAVTHSQNKIQRNCELDCCIMDKVMHSLCDSDCEYGKQSVGKKLFFPTTSVDSQSVAWGRGNGFSDHLGQCSLWQLATRCQLNLIFDEITDDTQLSTTRSKQSWHCIVISWQAGKLIVLWSANQLEVWRHKWQWLSWVFRGR